MTLPELNKAIEAAVGDIAIKRDKSVKADQAAQIAKQEYVAAVAKIRELHTEYQRVMQDILSFGGTVHA